MERGVSAAAVRCRDCLLHGWAWRSPAGYFKDIPVRSVHVWSAARATGQLLSAPGLAAMGTGYCLYKHLENCNLTLDRPRPDPFGLTGPLGPWRPGPSLFGGEGG